MSDPIKVGDLVQVVRGHECWFNKHGGMVFWVAGIIAQQGGAWMCPRCQRNDIEPDDKYGAQAEVSTTKGIPLSWLKRIPPLEELEGQRSEESLHAH